MTSDRTIVRRAKAYLATLLLCTSVLLACDSTGEKRAGSARAKSRLQALFEAQRQGAPGPNGSFQTDEPARTHDSPNSVVGTPVEDLPAQEREAFYAAQRNTKAFKQARDLLAPRRPL